MLQFDVMERDRLISQVRMDGDDVTVIRYHIGALYPFSNIQTEVTTGEVYAFLQSRVFPRGRDNEDAALHALGLRAYNVYDIIEKTKGKLPTDNLWVRITERD